MRSSDVVHANVQGDVVLLNTRSWVYLEFDRVGSAVWALLDVPRTLPSLVEALRQTFEIDEARCTADTQSFLDEMIAQGAVNVAGTP